MISLNFQNQLSDSESQQENSRLILDVQQLSARKFGILYQNMVIDKHLLMALHWMKVYTTLDALASSWKVDTKTFSKWTKKIIELLSFFLPDVNCS